MNKFAKLNSDTHLSDKDSELYESLWWDLRKEYQAGDGMGYLKDNGVPFRMIVDKFVKDYVANALQAEIDRLKEENENSKQLNAELVEALETAFKWLNEWDMDIGEYEEIKQALAKARGQE